MKRQKKFTDSKQFTMYEIWDGKRYMFDVSPRENPHEVLEQTRGRRLRLVAVTNGNRRELETYIPEQIAEDFEYEDYSEEYERNAA